MSLIGIKQMGEGKRGSYFLHRGSYILRAGIPKVVGSIPTVVRHIFKLTRCGYTLRVTSQAS
jgi:hypothetical protein